MKRSLIITIGILIILVVLGVWVYLLFFGAPESREDIYSNLGVNGENTPPPPTVVEDLQTELPQTQVDTASGGLQQLTTRPVAGFGFMGTSSSLLRYVERGTGHIYELDIDTGSETRVSRTTIPRVVRASFSEDGSGVILISEDGTERTVLIGTIDAENTSAEYVTLSADVFDATFINETTVGYAAYEDRGVGGYEYNMITREPLRLFLIPLSDVQMIWDDGPYVYNSPTRHFKGSLYAIENSDLIPLTPGEYGFVGGINERYIFGSNVRDQGYSSYARNRETGERLPLATTYIPEKCSPVVEAPDILWCASPFQDQNREYVENWYKGIISSEDALWRINIPFGEAQLVSDFFDESGRLIDVDGLVSATTGSVVLFKNKVDNTLWMYDTRTE